MLLSNLCKPLDIFRIKNDKTGKTYASQGIRTALFILMIVMFLIGITVFKDWFSILITNEVIKIIIALVIVAFFAFLGLNWLTKKIAKEKKIPQKEQKIFLSNKK